MSITDLIQPLVHPSNSFLRGSNENIYNQVNLRFLNPVHKAKSSLGCMASRVSVKTRSSQLVVEYFRGIGRLLFFNRNETTHSDPNAVIRTLIHWLASFDAPVESTICSDIERDRNVATAPI